MNQAETRITLGKRKIILVGTAHISQKSVEQVEQVIKKELPDCVCLELDESRYQSLTKKSAWSNLDISKVLKEKKGFLLLANLVLASFQRRLGLDMGIKPGEEMVKALRVAQELGIAHELCDRKIQVTLRRAWAKTGFWGKNKMLAALLSTLFTNQKISQEEMEKLKDKNMLQGMLEEVAEFLPKVKEVLIDERDRYLATNIFKAKGKKIVAVMGAGHIEGIVKHLKQLDKKQQSLDVSSLDEVPPKGILAKIIPWVIPVFIVGWIVLGFIFGDLNKVINMAWTWFLSNGIPSAIGALIALAHPLAIVAVFFAAPITSLIPVIGAGMVSGLLQYYLRKPRVKDFEALHDDLLKFTGFYKNRILHVLLVFFLPGLGSTVGSILGAVLLPGILGS